MDFNTSDKLPINRKIVKGDAFVHYKGAQYRVIDIGMHTETGEECVIYYNIKQPTKIWIRPLDMFNEYVIDNNNNDILRFTNVTIFNTIGIGGFVCDCDK